MDNSLTNISTPSPEEIIREVEKALKAVWAMPMYRSVTVPPDPYLVYTDDKGTV